MVLGIHMHSYVWDSHSRLGKYEPMSSYNVASDACQFASTSCATSLDLLKMKLVSVFVSGMAMPYQAYGAVPPQLGMQGPPLNQVTQPTYTGDVLPEDVDENSAPGRVPRLLQPRTSQI